MQTILRSFFIWLLGLACGLSIASWLIASERFGDAIVMVYLGTGLAVLSVGLLIYLRLRPRRHKQAADRQG